MKKSVGTNIFYNVARTALSIVFPLITFPYITRKLGADAIGRYNFSISIVSYFILIAGLGINTYAVREGTKEVSDKKKISKFSNQIFTINIIATLCSYILMTMLIYFIPRFAEYRETILILSLEIICTTVGVNWLFSIYENFKILTIAYFITQCISLILMFVFVQTQADYIKYIWIATFISIFPNLFCFIYSRRYVKISLTLHPEIKHHIRPILLLFATTIATTIYVSADTTMLGWMTTNTVVGYYSVSAKIYKIVKQVLNSIVLVIIPRAASLVQNDGEFRKLVSIAGNALILLLLPAMVGLFVLSPEIVYVIAGEEFIKATSSLRILSVALFFSVIGNLYANCILIPLKKEKEVLKITIVSAIVNVGLNLFLIPVYGQNAAALTTLISEILVVVYCMFVAKKQFNMSLELDLRSIVISCISSIAIVGICILVKAIFINQIMRMIVGTFLSVSMYLIVLVKTKNPYVRAFIK